MIIMDQAAVGKCVFTCDCNGHLIILSFYIFISVIVVYIDILIL